MRLLRVLVLSLATSTALAQTDQGCSATPCLLPSQPQATALFTRIELLYPQLFFPGGLTQSEQLGSDAAWFRLYGAAGLAS